MAYDRPRRLHRSDRGDPAPRVDISEVFPRRFSVHQPPAQWSEVFCWVTVGTSDAGRPDSGGFVTAPPPLTIILVDPSTPAETESSPPLSGVSPERTDPTTEAIDSLQPLRDRVDAAGYDIADDVLAGLGRYAQIMWAANESLNLTRHTTWDLFVGRDLRDCVALANLLDPGEEVLDLGSGNGVPGIPVAIMRPDVDVSLAESVGKRAAALNDIVAACGLPVAVYNARGEDLLEDFRFSTIMSRAVGSLAKFCRWMAPHWATVDRMLLVKGPKWVDERAEARHLGLMNELSMRRVAAYPLGADDAGEGVILEVRHRSKANATEESSED